MLSIQSISTFRKASIRGLMADSCCICGQGLAIDHSNALDWCKRLRARKLLRLTVIVSKWRHSNISLHSMLV